MWSTIRTVLAVLNVIGALAFCAVAAMDYGVRHTWSYAVLLHDLYIDGMPVDDKYMTAENEKLVDLLGENGTKDAFDRVSNPVATQKAEVDRIKAKLSAKIDGSTDKREQLVTLARILTPMVVTEAQRERLMAIQNYLGDAKTAGTLKSDLVKAARTALDPKQEPKKPFAQAFAEQVQALRGASRLPFVEAIIAEQAKPSPKKPDEMYDDAIEQLQQNLRASFEDAFKAVDKPAPGSQEASPAEKRMVIASLLLDLNEAVRELEGNNATVSAPVLANDPTFSRYLNIVGLQAGVRAVRQRAIILADMANELRLESERDRNGFVEEHQAVYAILQQEAQKVANLAEALERERDLVAKRDALVNRRKQDIEIFDAELAKLSKESAERLAEVRKMNEEMYKVRVATRNASEENLKFEEKIRSLEHGR